MILSSVSETLAAVSRHPAVESAIAALRQGNSRERLAGLTETAKALLAAIVAAELRRPMVVLAHSGARAETFAASMQFFYSALAGQEASQILKATLQKLSPDLREAVILRDLQEMEYREIAEVLQIPEGTVKSRINRGRAELARLLRKQKLTV